MKAAPASSCPPLSTIRDADQVLVINGGEIIERGTHDSLLARRLYHRMYWSQFKGRSRSRWVKNRIT